MCTSFSLGTKHNEKLKEKQKKEQHLPREMLWEKKNKMNKVMEKKKIMR